MKMENESVTAFEYMTVVITFSFFSVAAGCPCGCLHPKIKTSKPKNERGLIIAKGFTCLNINRHFR